MLTRTLTASLVALMLLIGGCSFGTGSGGPANKTMTVEMAFTFTSLDPPAQIGDTSLLAGSQIYQTLLQVDQADPSKVDPNLAESYVASLDGRSVTLKLRHDVRFSDGTPMTSDDVVFSLNRFLNLGTATSETFLGGLAFTALDKYTVVVSSVTPNLSMVFRLAYPQVSIVNSKLVKANGGTDATNANTTDTATQYLNSHSAGSGPYVLVSNDPQVQIVLKANPNYWGPKPVYSQLVFRNVPPATELLDVQRGQHTVALSISANQASTLDRSKLNIETSPSSETFQLDLSQNPANSPATSNPDFRQALRYGIDYAALVRLAGLGAVQAQGLLATGIPGALPANQLLSRDVTKAKSFLAQSGLKNPTFTLTYATDSNPYGIDYGVLAQEIQANLKEIGINVILSPTTINIMFRSFFTPHTKLQAVLTKHGGDDPATLLNVVPGRVVGLFLDWTAGTDPALDALVTEFANATTAAQRDALAVQLGNAVNADGVCIPILRGPFVLVTSKDVSGIKLVPNILMIRFWDVA